MTLCYDCPYFLSCDGYPCIYQAFEEDDGDE